MNEAVRFPFTDANSTQPGTSLMPFLPLVLSCGGGRIEALGLLDTGAAVNVLPISLGEQLGFSWDEERTPLVLSGILARLPARGVLVSVSVAISPRFVWVSPGRNPTMSAFSWVRRISFWSSMSVSSGLALSSR